MNKIKSEKSLINMDNIKIIFFDIDGTLIDMNRKCISENTLNFNTLKTKKDYSLYCDWKKSFGFTTL